MCRVGVDELQVIGVSGLRALLSSVVTVCLSSVLRVVPCTFLAPMLTECDFLKNVTLLLKLSVHISILVVLMHLFSIIMILLPA